jgi:acetylglutamate kinase
VKKKLSIVKIGGNVIENKDELSNFVQLFCDLKGPKILVHGGGKRATQIGEKLGIKTQMSGGRRITNDESLEVVVMVYAGLVNKNIVALLQANGCNAIGLSGADGNCIKAHKRLVKDIDYGYAGDIDKVDDRVISDLLKAGLIPVFCAITHDEKGQLLNTNADTIASEIAIGMSKDFETTLYYCFEKKGVLEEITEEDSVIKHIDAEIYQQLLEKGVIARGMLPKLENCFHALNKNVCRVCIGDTGMLMDGSHLFTTITL